MGVQVALDLYGSCRALAFGIVFAGAARWIVLGKGCGGAEGG